MKLNIAFHFLPTPVSTISHTSANIWLKCVFFSPWILTNTVHVILSIKCLSWGGFVLGGFVVRWVCLGWICLGWVCLGWICLGWVCLGWICLGWVCRSLVLSEVGLSVYPFLSVCFNLSRTCPYIRTYETYRK